MNTFYIDLMFLFFIVSSALLTPKSHDHKIINNVLAGKFIIMISLGTIISMVGTDGVWVDIYRSGLDFIFVKLFLMAGGVFLAFLCLIMGILHFANIFLGLSHIDYAGLMIGFQILQLMWISWGAADGLTNMVFSACTWCRLHFRNLAGH